MIGVTHVEVQIVFFFQAEDGIRDKLVTGVQTCALPIWRRSRRGVATLALCLGLGAVVVPARAGTVSTAEAAASSDSGFTQVATLPLLSGQVGNPKQSGWLIFNPQSRRIYEVFEAGSTTTLQSFDLDTLQPRHRDTFDGLPIAAGYGAYSGAGGTLNSGEVVHAVDQAAGRLYLPLSLTVAGTNVPAVGANLTLGPDGRRPLGRILVVDEARFDAGDPAAYASFDLLGGSQARLQAYYLMGLTTSRRHLADPGGPAALVGLFAAPYRPPQVPVLPPTPLPAPYDHTIAQWPTDGLRFEATAKDSATSLTSLGVAADWEQVLTPCVRAPVRSPGGVEVPTWDTNYQWGLFVGDDAVWTACQSELYAGAIVRVGLAPRDPAGIRRPNPGDQQVFPVSQPISDLFVDEGGGRLLLRSWSPGGTTWWAFDTAERRYTGSVAATPVLTQGMGVGIDPTTGRLYGLTRNYTTGNHPAVPVRGGLFYSDTRLEPTPPMENVAPELAYPSYWRIAVDPPTRRFFVRRGTWEGTQYVYPSTTTTAPAPAENFYRVFRDDIAVPVQPGDVDDSAVTTDVEEKEGLTTASYLGTGQGYGARTVLTGGLASVSTGASDLGDSKRSTCSRDDRELVSGAAGPVSVSDQSVGAEAASLDADAATRQALGNPASRCKPQAPSPQGDQVNKCQNVPNNDTTKAGTTVDSDELAFDEPKSPREDRNPADGCADRDGTNRYATRTECDAERPEGSAKADEVGGKNVPRRGFSASVSCDRAKDTAEATSTGSLGAEQVDTLQSTMVDKGAPLPADSFVRVATATSTVTVSPRKGGGIETKVDSIARGIEIPGVGRIGVARAESTSYATGRTRRAKGTYTRTICDVEVGGQSFARGSCLDGPLQKDLVKLLNDRLTGKGQVRLRTEDEKLADGSDSGYRAAVQRDRRERFADTVIDRDSSLAVPALEIVLYVGDGGGRGAGRQIVQLAGAQAATTYGIACLYGQKDNGKCARDDEYGAFDDDDLGTALAPEPGEPVYVTETVTETVVEPGAPSASDGGGKGGNRIVRLIQRIPELAADALRLLFSNPREFGLLAAVWALLYAPCYLGERRRSLGGLRARRAVA